MTLALALSLALAAADAGTPKVQPLGFQSRAVPNQVKLGEPFIYELIVTHRPNERYELLRPKDLGDFELFDVQRSRVDGEDGRAVTTFKARMSMFALGLKPLPAFTFEVVGEHGAQTWVPPALDVEGLSSLPDDAEQTGVGLKDIRPPEDVPIRSYRLLWVLAGLLAGAALGYLAWRAWKNRQARPAFVPPPLPLGERTRSALDALRAEDLPGKARSQEFYFRLSEIVRGYLGERYAFEALECTSGELLERLRRLPTPGLPIDEVTRFSDESDLVKFAREDATAEQCRQALDLAYLILDRTWPPPPPPSASQPPPPPLTLSPAAKTPPHGSGPVAQ